MHVEEYGDPENPRLVLLHGGGVAGWMWQRQVEHFRRTHHVLVPDLPGHGHSSVEDFTTISGAADAVAGMLEQRGRGPVNLAGFSLGAQIAVDLVSRRPGLVQRVMVVSALVRPLPGAELGVRAARLAAPLARSRAFARLQARALFIGPDLFEDYFGTSRRISPRTLANVLRANAGFRIPPGWSRTPAQAAVVAGRQERAVMRRSAEALAAALPGSRLLVVPRRGHGIPLQDPAMFNQLLEEWLG
jgi:pimeloyl-ACP methyl ester carboxylesterase